jgi:hypothetical protein
MLTQELLLELFEYDYITGYVVNRVTRNGTSQKGNRAGSKEPNGYRRIGLMYNHYGEHQIIWMMVYGWWPDEIDHINGIRDDNRLYNLREVTRSQNRTNSNCGYGKSGLYGAHWIERIEKWHSRIVVEGRQIYLGSFNTAQEAHEKAVIASKEYHGEYTSYAYSNLK